MYVLLPLRVILQIMSPKERGLIVILKILTILLDPVSGLSFKGQVSLFNFHFLVQYSHDLKSDLERNCLIRMTRWILNCFKVFYFFLKIIWWNNGNLQSLYSVHGASIEDFFLKNILGSQKETLFQPVQLLTLLTLSHKLDLGRGSILLADRFITW